MKPKEWNWETLRARANGRDYWRSLDELADDPECRALLQDEFPDRDVSDQATRRDILRWMGLAFAMTGAAACTKQPQERIMPYVRQPEEVILGLPMYFATAMPMRGSAVGLLVKSFEGRPVKAEGNAQHPESMGGTLPWNQTSTFDLYDPDRSQAVIHRGQISSWDSYLTAAADFRKTGQGLHILYDALNSPTLTAQKTALTAALPGIVWHEYDPVADTNANEGARLALGDAVTTIYRFDTPDVIVSLDADFLYSMPGSTAYARQFISRRHAESDRRRMSRLYVAEPSPSITGDKADNRLRIKAGQVEALARALAAAVGVPTAAGPSLQEAQSRWVASVARDLTAHRGTSLVVAGQWQSPAAHALAHAMNAALGNVGHSVSYAEPSGSQPQPLRPLVDAMNAGQVKTLMILGANPVYDAPPDLQFARALDKVPLRIHHGLHQNETAELCHWHIPAAHFLESWGDVRAYDGTVSIIQPLIAPLYGGKSVHEFLASLTDNPSQSGYELVKKYWASQRTNVGNFEDYWERSLESGVIPDTAYAARTPAAPRDMASLPAGAGSGQGLELVFRPDHSVWDGRFANNAYLQETPRPHNKLTWDNAVLVSPATARRLDLLSEDVVEIAVRGFKVEAPVFVTPGQADDSLLLHLGYGRTVGGRNAKGTGVNAYKLRASDTPYFAEGVQLRKLDRKYDLASTQTHHSMEGRDIVRAAPNSEYLKNPDLFLTEPNEEKETDQITLSLYPEWKYNGYRWAMAIDQNACIGCQACVAACTIENNVPVVGKAQVRRSREMHWLRIDRYFTGNLDNPDVQFQPMLCQHCEKAPCEPVCPVAATVHSGEGLSQMVYNRCVGTRYCSNNCPYKVRRFNFLLWQDWTTPSLEPFRNPDVTVRSRGVMEKCSFCVQRIQAAKIESEKEDRRIRDGEVVTACQAACPTEAIIFGDLNDPQSRVLRLHRNSLAYGVLTELSTQPRIRYMARLTNKNPELGGQA